ncbi:17872_t:CDS:2 [Funneliformis geosporum]|uniref:17872_t:CDS:1 n=1 Tax=Funneliformis geosporum TaxID=1117311 RepID=A0A9W4WLZ3_9GLOM|nr:17872_t:CDS:2 [Funneliformis geosporum]
MNGHTLLLFQKCNKPRTWTEHENITLAIEAIITMYETRLAESRPTRGQIHYQVGDLIGFISQCKEFAALVYDQTISAYVPRDKAWLQEKIVAHLRKKVGNQVYSYTNYEIADSLQGGRRNNRGL